MTASDASNCGIRVATIIDDPSQDQDTGVIHDERHMTIKIYSQYIVNDVDATKSSS